MNLLDDRTHLRSVQSAHRRPVRRAEGQPVGAYLLACRLLKRVKKAFSGVEAGFWQSLCFAEVPPGDCNAEYVAYRIEQAGVHTVTALLADLDRGRPFEQVVKRALGCHKARKTALHKPKK